MKKQYIHLLSLYHIYKTDPRDREIREKLYRDLNIEVLFPALDHTLSAPGKQYLYHILCEGKKTDIDSYEACMEQLSPSSSLNLRIRKHLKKLAHPDAYYIASLLEEPFDSVREKEWLIVRLLRFLPLLLGGLTLIFHKPVLLLLFVAALICNALYHYRIKIKMQPYFYSVPQLRILLQQAEELMQIEEISSLSTEVQQDSAGIRNLKQHLALFRFSIKLENDLAIVGYMISELFRIFFLSEAYAVIRAFRLMRNRKELLEKVYLFVARTDVLLSIAELRHSLPGFCLPEETQAYTRIYTRDMYHPLIPGCIPNSICIKDRSILITGSNMTGKTSFIRTVGINILCGKTLHTCFAREMCFSMDLQVFSCLQVQDSLTEGKSLFLKEADIVGLLIEKSGKGRCVFLLDEMFRGTNTRERIAIGKAVLSYLAETGNIVLASTHDLELSVLLEKQYTFYHFSETVKDDKLYFDYLLKPGISSGQNAIHLLRICGYPEKVVKEALLQAGQKTE